MELQAVLNRMAGTTNMDAQGAANVICGTTQVELVKCLNVIAGTTNLAFNGAAKKVAELYGGNPLLDANDALDSASGFLSGLGSGGAVGSPGNGLVAYWKANQYSGTGNLLDLTGRGRNAAMGAGANAPTWLKYEGEKYAYLPGIAGNYLSSPDSAALSITGDIDVRVKAALSTWITGATNQTLTGKHTTGNYLLRIAAAGHVMFTWYDNTAATFTRVSTAIPALTNGVSYWIRATLDVDNGAAGHDVKFYTSIDGTTWVQLGTTVTTAGVTNIRDTTDVLEIGTANAGTSNFATGAFYRVQIRNGIDGPIAFDWQASSCSEPFATCLESSSNAATVTINRAATGKKTAIVDRSMFLFGTDDYMEVADHNDFDFGTGDFTIALALRSYGQPAAAHFMTHRSTSGWLIYSAAGGAAVTGFVQDVSAVQTSDSGPVLSAGATSTLILKKTTTALELFTSGVSNGSTALTATGSSDTALPLRFGSASTSAAFSDFIFIAAAVFRRALSATEITQLSADLLL